MAIAIRQEYHASMHLCADATPMLLPKLQALS